MVWVNTPSEDIPLQHFEKKKKSYLFNSIFGHSFVDKLHNCVEGTYFNDKQGNMYFLTFHGAKRKKVVYH